jgi:mono/diheme cytochrome c family protein
VANCAETAIALHERGGEMNKNLVLAMAVALALATGCGSARRSPPLVEPLPLTAELRQGYEVFMVHCHPCHPGGEAGLGPALNNKPLPRFMMRLQVRRGLGAMPAFPEEVISNEELDRLLDYLLALRRHG